MLDDVNDCSIQNRDGCINMHHQELLITDVSLRGHSTRNFRATENEKKKTNSKADITTNSFQLMKNIHKRHLIVMYSS